MDKFLLTSIIILSLVYALRLIRNKFIDEKRKEILLLQVIIFTLFILTFLSGRFVLYIPIALFVGALAICPKRFFDFVSKYF